MGRRTPTRTAAAAALAVVALVVTAIPALAADDVAVRELTVAYSDVNVALDPLHAFTATEAQLFTALSEGLVSYHPVTLDPVPGVAHTWHVSDDGLRYRFLLRDNARFSDGTRVVAGDFRASWLRIINPGEQAEYSLMFDVIRGVADYRSGTNTNESEVGIRVISEGELEVVLERPAEHFLSTLAHHAFAPVYPAYRAQVGWERQAPIIGNGPFSVTEWQSGELVFERNPHYWARSTVELDRIRIRFLGDADAIDTAFMAGTIHWANYSRFTEQLAPFIVANRLFGTTYFVFRSSDPPFDDVRVRRALALMVPWATVRSTELVRIPTSVLVPGLANYPDVAGITAEDQRAARRLLEQAGFTDGNGLPPIIMKVANPWAATLAATIKAAWETQLGVDVTVAHIPEYDDYLAEIKAGTFTLTISSWIGDFTDPISFLQMWTTASNLNDAGYASRDYDRMIDQATGSTGLDRLQLLAEAEELLLQDAVILPVSHLVSFSLIDLQRIDGWTPNLLDIHPFRYLGFRRADLPAGVAAVSELAPG
jgi:peptide/nickel transport system substrate-binding protein/oligopeptide transport system substrate-binding protein